MANAKMRQRIATNPKFIRTRENNAEFANAAEAGKLLSDAFRSVSFIASDKKLTTRLTTFMEKVVKTDPLSDRGQRKVAGGDVSMLRDFDFNAGAKLRTIFFAPFTATIDRVTGAFNVNVVEFVPTSLLKVPPGTTHFSVVAAASAIDFTAGAFTSVESASAVLAYGEQQTEAIALTNTLPANSTLPLFLGLSIRFFQEVNGKFYALNSGAHNALSLVAVDVPAPAP